MRTDFPNKYVKIHEDIIDQTNTRGSISRHVAQQPIAQPLRQPCRKFYSIKGFIKACVVLTRSGFYYLLLLASVILLLNKGIQSQSLLSECIIHFIHSHYTYINSRLFLMRVGRNYRTPSYILLIIVHHSTHLIFWFSFCVYSED